MSNVSSLLFNRVPTYRLILESVKVTLDDKWKQKWSRIPGCIYSILDFTIESNQLHYAITKLHSVFKGEKNRHSEVQIRCKWKPF